MRWRMDTAYGDTPAAPAATDVERYLRWAYDMRKLMKVKKLDQPE